MVKEVEENCITEIGLLNIQGLTKHKLMEIEREMNEHKVLCLTETHQKVDGINLSKGLLKIESHREKTEKKVEGLW